MDSLITAAAQALAVGDPLAALKRVALRDDAPALALRGIAMAQLGDFGRARALLKSAVQAFPRREVVARARCIIAQAEIALVSRDLSWSEGRLDTAREALTAHGDHLNAAHARNLEARRLLLVGRLNEAQRLVETHDPVLPPALATARALILAGIAIRRLQTGPARIALTAARAAARASGIPALAAEVETAAEVLETTAARLIMMGEERPLLLEEVEALLASGTFVIDACRNVVRNGEAVVSLASRPVLFALARALAEAWPGDASRATLLVRAFHARHADESHRARLRVEMARLRTELSGFAEVTATADGFILVPAGGQEIAVLAPPVDERHAAVLAFLADGEAWSSSALAIALAASPRTVQRALEQLAEAGKVQSFGRGRAVRWTIPSVPGFPTTLLLPGPLPGS